MPDPEVEWGNQGQGGSESADTQANSGTVREEFSFEVVATSLEAHIEARARECEDSVKPVSGRRGQNRPSPWGQSRFNRATG